MHPPKHILDKLQEMHKWVRIGWLASPRQGPEDLNAGYFSLLQLYHKRDADVTFLVPWEDRGPVYGKEYDRLTRVPIWLANITKEEMFSGDVIDMLKRWMIPMSKRKTDSEIAKGKEVTSAIKDIARDKADYLMWKARETSGEGAPVIANKFLTRDDVETLNGTKAAKRIEALEQSYISSDAGVPMR